MQPFMKVDMDLHGAENEDCGAPRPGFFNSELCSLALHVRSLRLYEEFHRDANAKSPASKLLEVISRCKSILASTSQNQIANALAALRKKGTAHLILHQAKRALTTADHIIRLRVDWPFGYLLKADACLGLGHFAAAAQLYELTQQLMPAEDPTDDFGRTEIADQRSFLSDLMARMSCLTMTAAHNSEITAVSCWPSWSPDSASHSVPTGTVSARALQETVSCAVNQALQMMSHGSGYAHVPLVTRGQPAAGGFHNDSRPCEPTLDHIFAGDGDGLGGNLALPGMLHSGRAGTECMSELDTVGSIMSAPEEGSATNCEFQLPLRASATIPLQGCCPAAHSEHPAVLQHDTSGYVQCHPQLSAGTPCQTPRMRESGALAPQLTSSATLTSEGVSTGSLQLSTLSRTDHQCFIATGDLQGCLRLWDVVKMECCADLQGHSSGITCVSFAKGLRKGCALILASADAEGDIMMSAVDLSGNLIESQALDKQHRNRIVSMQFYAEGHKLITSSVDTTVRLWSVATGQCIGCLDGHKRPVTGMDCTSIMSAMAVATCCVNGSWYLWDLKLKRHLRSGRRPGAASLVRFSPAIHAFIQSRPLLVTAHWGNKEASLHVWDVFDPDLESCADTALKPWHSFLSVARGQVQDIAFTSSAQHKFLMAVVALDGSIIIYDLFARSVLTHMTDGHCLANGAILPISTLLCMQLTHFLCGKVWTMQLV